MIAPIEREAKADFAPYAVLDHAFPLWVPRRLSGNSTSTTKTTVVPNSFKIPTFVKMFETSLERVHVHLAHRLDQSHHHHHHHHHRDKQHKHVTFFFGIQRSDPHIAQSTARPSATSISIVCLYTIVLLSIVTCTYAGQKQVCEREKCRWGTMRLK